MEATSSQLQRKKYVCNACKVTRDEEEFNKNGSRATGRDSRCKRCISKLKKHFYRGKRKTVERALSFKSLIVNRLSEDAIETCGLIFGESIRGLIDAGKL